MRGVEPGDAIRNIVRIVDEEVRDERLQGVPAGACQSRWELLDLP
jgi:hypothetical protein